MDEPKNSDVFPEIIAKTWGTVKEYNKKNFNLVGTVGFVLTMNAK